MTAAKRRRFNVSGPCFPSDHHMLPALARIPDVHGLIDLEHYFTLRAPRQSGKTTVVMAAVDRINDDGKYYALYCSLGEICNVSDKTEAMGMIIGNLASALKVSRVDALKRTLGDSFSAGFHAWPDSGSSPVKAWLGALCARLDKDLVVFFDEADCLGDQVLLSFLSQLRVGFAERPEVPFPRSMAFIGMREIQYRKFGESTDPRSMAPIYPFNVIAKRLTLPNFTLAEVKDLYAQHTEATGQSFEDGAAQRAWFWSDGQPWLVNALALRSVEQVLGEDYGTAITAGHIDQAAANLLGGRDNHIDYLLGHLSLPRLRRFFLPMLAGSENPAILPNPFMGDDSLDDDFQLCLDLGLVKWDDLLRPANPVYACAMVRYFNWHIQKNLPGELSGRWMDGRNLDMTGLLREFQRFWAHDPEKYLEGRVSADLGPHLLLSAYLQRVIGGGGSVINDLANGRGYAEIVVRYAGRDYPLWLTIGPNGPRRAEMPGLLAKRMAGLPAKEAWLVAFDLGRGKSLAGKNAWETETMPNGSGIHLVGC
ncbi:MAG: hypothetical protein LBF58_03060 [Deltaproteobacteria bacterium]|jgi:hypothetical protein|nr:hypothetical protein [Deltaproteobacteria bacterium]